MDVMTGQPSADAFRARFPWKGGDLQTVRNALARPTIDLGPWPSETLQFATDDGSGDLLIGQLARPAAGDDAGDDAGTAGPLVILIHGLTGCEDSIYVRATARHLLQAGHAVLRLNLRGAGPTRSLCHEQYHAGRTEDFAGVLHQLPETLSARGVFAVGYSLGGNMLLKYLGEQGSGAPLMAAATVSAPIDLATTSHRFHRRRNYIYKRYLLDRMKKDALLARGGLPSLYQTPVQQSRTIYEYDDVYVAPRYGFGTADTYYSTVSANRFMPDIQTPTLVVHALDDPWIASEPYQAFAWRDFPSLVPGIQANGGHVGFHGRGSHVTWYDAQIQRFFAAAA